MSGETTQANLQANGEPRPVTGVSSDATRGATSHASSTDARLRVAVIGATGLLGRPVYEALAQDPRYIVTGTAFTRARAGLVTLDVTNAGAVETFFASYRPQAVILTAAERRPDVCEQDPVAAHALNVGAVEIVARLAQAQQAWMLSISTDYVFDGSAAPYRPDSMPHPLNAYGRGKLEGERALAGALDHACVLRLPLLYGPLTDTGESAATSFLPALERATSAQPAVIDDWAIRYPTYTPDVADVIAQLVERVAHAKPVVGIHHWSGDEAMTKYDIALALAERLGIDSECIRAQSSPADATPRPYDCHLDSASLVSLGIGKRTPFATGLDTVLARLAGLATDV